MIAAKSVVIWFVLIAAEILHGIVRAVLFVPPCRRISIQIGVFTGSLIILVIALVSMRWIGATRSSQLLRIGILWLVQTLPLSSCSGISWPEPSWERLASDYNVLRGGLLPFGMVDLALSPWIAGKVRGLV